MGREGCRDWTRLAATSPLAGEERERLGRCLAGLALAHVDEGQGLYTFRRAGGFEGTAFTEGEMVVLSMEGEACLV